MLDQIFASPPGRVRTVSTQGSGGSSEERKFLRWQRCRYRWTGFSLSEKRVRKETPRMNPDTVDQNDSVGMNSWF